MKLHTWKPVTFFNKDSNAGASLWNFRKFWKQPFARTSANNCSWSPQKNKSIGCIRKIVVLGKPVNDTIEQQVLFIENMNLMNLFCAIFTLFVISFRQQKRAKSIMTTILKYLEPPIVAEQFQIVLNKLNEKIRIFSNPINFSHFYVIYF